MKENVEIGISTNIDSKGLDQLRKALNEQRNELNAVARETDKTDIKYKQLKATVSELNRIMKLSDDELKRYASSLIPVEKNIDKVVNAKGRMNTATEKLSRSFSSLKTNVGSYSTTIVNLSSDIAQGDKSIMQSVGTLGLYAGGWVAVASAVYLATQNLVEYLNIDSAKIKNLESNMPKTGDILNGTDGSLNYYEKKRTGLFFDYNIGPQWDKTNTPYSPTRESMPGPFDAERMAGIYARDHKIGGNGKTLKETKEELNEIQRLQKDLLKLESDKTNYISLYGEQANIVLETLKKIEETQKRIDLLTGQKVIYDTSGIKLEERKMPLFSSEDIRQAQYQAESDYIDTLGKKEKSSDTLQDIETGYSLIAQSMTLLNIGTDTFVGKLMSVFGFVNSALSVGSSIIKFVTSIIPGVPDSMISSNTSVDTNRLINQNISMSSSPVNIYMSSNVSQKYFKAQIEGYNSMKQYTKV